MRYRHQLYMYICFSSLIGLGCRGKKKTTKGCPAFKKFGNHCYRVSSTQIAHILVPFIQNGEKNKSKLFMSHN